MVTALRGADPGELLLAGCCFALALVCSAASWRSMLGGSVRFPDACARYGAGSLTNTFLPGRAGDAIRLVLFGRVVPGGKLAVAGAIAAVGAARWLALLPLGIAGAIGNGLPPAAVALAGLALAPLLVAWLCARGGSRRAGALLAPLRYADRSTYAVLATWVGGTVLARIAAATSPAARSASRIRSPPRCSSCPRSTRRNRLGPARERRCGRRRGRVRLPRRRPARARGARGRIRAARRGDRGRPDRRLRLRGSALVARASPICNRSVSEP